MAADFTETGGGTGGLSAATGKAAAGLGDVEDEDPFLLDDLVEDLSFFLSLLDLLDFSLLSCSRRSKS